MGSLTHMLNQIAPPLDQTGDYPRRWSEYVGQEQAKKMLQVAAHSARIRKAPLDHVLIAHPGAGVGKTALGNLIATELRRPCRVVSGALTSTKARLLFSEMADRDVLLYDEFHQLLDNGKKKAEWILHYLQDGVIMGPQGPEEQPKVTILAATTDVHKIPDTIVSRFPLKPALVEYTTEEAAKIAIVLARKVLVDMPPLKRRDALVLAQAANSNPRAIRSQLMVLRDLVVTDTLPVVGGRYNVTGLLEWQDITIDGLDRIARRYLQVLATEFDGSAGERALATRLQQAGSLGLIERVLVERGLVARTRTGRVLTTAGIQRVKELESA